ELVGVLPGHPPWGAEADAALAQVALARGDDEAAAEAARSAFTTLQSAHLEDLFLRIVLPAARVLLAAGTPDEREQVRGQLTMAAALTAERVAEGGAGARWSLGPRGGELSPRAGGLRDGSWSEQPAPPGPAAALGEGDPRLLWLLIEGRTNREVASELGMTED